MARPLRCTPTARPLRVRATPGETVEIAPVYSAGGPVLTAQPVSFVGLDDASPASPQAERTRSGLFGLQWTAGPARAPVRGKSWPVRGKSWPVRGKSWAVIGGDQFALGYELHRADEPVVGPRGPRAATAPAVRSGTFQPLFRRLPGLKVGVPADELRHESGQLSAGLLELPVTW